MTQGEHAIWGELRGALSAPPEDRWVRVCDVLDDAMRASPSNSSKSNSSRIVCARCARRRTIASALRLSTGIGALMRGEEVPALALCTELFAKEMGLDDETAPKLLSSPHLVGIERLDLRWNDIGPRRRAGAWRTTPRWPG